MPSQKIKMEKEKNDGNSNNKKKSKIFKVAAGILLAIGLIATAFLYVPIQKYFPSLLQTLEKLWRPEKNWEKSILHVFPEIPEICLRFQIILETGKGEKISWKDFEEKKGKIELYYQHAQSSVKTIEISEERLLEGNFSWEIPLEIQNGMLSFWASVKLDNFSPILCDKLSVSLKRQEDRQLYSKALQIEELYYHDVAEYEKIIQAFARYLQDFPNGLFSKKAQETLSLYHDKASTYEYQELMNWIRNSPEELKEILVNCRTFSSKYPNFSRLSQIRTIEEYCETLLKEKSYEITLHKGHIPNKILNADCYVKVYVNQKLIWQSSIISDNNDPKWNEKFSIAWKAGSEIHVELWDKNIGLIKDKLYFSITAKNTFAIYCFEKRMENAKHWIEFTCNIPEKPY